MPRGFSPLVRHWHPRHCRRRRPPVFLVAVASRLRPVACGQSACDALPTWRSWPRQPTRVPISAALRFPR